jgi:hypothetical protein
LACEAGEWNKLARWAGLGWSDGYHAHNHEVIGYGPVGGPAPYYGQPTFAQPVMAAPTTLQPAKGQPVVSAPAPSLRAMPAAPRMKKRP